MKEYFELALWVVAIAVVLFLLCVERFRISITASNHKRGVPINLWDYVEDGDLLEVVFWHKDPDGTGLMLCALEGDDVRACMIPSHLSVRRVVGSSERGGPCRELPIERGCWYRVKIWEEEDGSYQRKPIILVDADGPSEDEDIEETTGN